MNRIPCDSASIERPGTPLEQRISRRAFLAGGALILAARKDRLLAATEERPALKIGLVTDIHHANRPPSGSRHYRESLGKLREVVARFVDGRCDLAVELGDLIDEAPSLEEELGFLEQAETEFSRFPGERHHVLGNHCVWTLTKEEFLGKVGERRSYRSVDRGGFHLVVLDACYRADGVPYGRKNFEWTDTSVPAEERKWLAQDLESSAHPAILFIHQRLDVKGDHGVKDAPEVRAILERSGKVLAVFQGHNHMNDHAEIGGIHYVTLAALVEGSGRDQNACGILEVHGDGSLRVEGFCKQAGHDLPKLEAHRSARV